jgi:hypothetical protein
MSDTPVRLAKAAETASRDPYQALTDSHWASILNDQSGTGGVPIQNRRLSEIPRHLLRVSCQRCDRIIEIQMADAVRLFGAHAVWKSVGQRLLDDGCQNRTGNRDQDGCWPSFNAS